MTGIWGCRSMWGNQNQNKKPLRTSKILYGKGYGGWKEKLLSRAGKEIMIKAVAQAIPTYAMGCFDLTKGLCDQISAIICRYWWSQREKENKLHWLSWEKLTKPKRKCGLGLLQQPDSLCARVLRAKYFPDGDCVKSQACSRYVIHLA